MQHGLTQRLFRFAASTLRRLAPPIVPAGARLRDRQRVFLIKRRHFFRAGLLVAGLLCQTSISHADMVLGVHPFKPATQLTAAFNPLANYLSEALGEKVSLHISRDYQEHIDASGRGELDIAYFGPSQYVKLRAAYGARPLLARQQIGSRPLFHAKIFVRADSPIRDLAGLAGKRFAFGSPHSTMSHLVPRYMLWQAGLPVERLSSHAFVGDHVNVALGVLAGEFDAGAVKEDVYFQYEKRGLRAIATSQPMSDHLFVASHKMPEARVQKLRSILLAMDRTAKGRAVLQSMTTGVTALVPAADSDYDSLRAVMDALKKMGVSEE